MTKEAFIAMIARLDTEDELDEQGCGTITDDMCDTLNRLIFTARKIMGVIDKP